MGPGRAALLIAAALAAAPAPAQEIQERLAAIAAAAGGTMGVSAVNVKTGERVRLNADQRFPMASTFKLPVAIKVLEQVERGAVRLEERVPIDPGNLSPGAGEINAAEPGEGTALTVAELLGAMMRASDNTAADLLLARIGGPAAVTAHLKSLGIEGIAVDRTAADLVADAGGIRLPPPGSRTRLGLQNAGRSVSPARRAAAVKAMLEDPRDTATPDAMVALLERLQAGKALGKRNTELLIDHMENSKTGPARLRGELPRGATVAHKTGTLLRIATNDVGIIPLGWSGGPMIIAVYIKGSTQPLEAQERAIAQAALALHRHFTR